MILKNLPKGATEDHIEWHRNQRHRLKAQRNEIHQNLHWTRNHFNVCIDSHRLSVTSVYLSDLSWFTVSLRLTQILTDCYRHRLCTWNQHNQETFQWHKISFEWGNTKEEIQHRQEFFLQHNSMDSNNLEPSWSPLQNHVQDTRIYLWSKDILRLLRFYKCNWPIKRGICVFWRYIKSFGKPAWIDAITNWIQGTIKVNFSYKSLKNHLFEIFWIIPERQSL